MTAQVRPTIAIACGGTGGHLYPGLAVAEQLLRRGCDVTLLISPKEVDQHAVKSVLGMEVVTLPAVGLTRGQVLSFLRGFVHSIRKAKEIFQASAPGAALAMGGFTSAPPLLAARRVGAKTFLHESNSVPGRANRWLSWIVNRAFVGFPSAAVRLHARDIVATGTPVRHQFQPGDAGACRSALGLAPGRPVVLVMGGSQGASGLNRLIIETLPHLIKTRDDWQWLHLTGQADLEEVKTAYSVANFQAIVHPFLMAMELALGASTVAISRAGASSLAELAAMRVPAVLVPYPAAVDDHQFHNARAFERTNAARLLSQREATADRLSQLLFELMQNALERQKIQRALEQWHAPAAAANIAESMLEISGIKAPSASATSLECGNGGLNSGPRSPASAPKPDRPALQRAHFDEFEPVCDLALNRMREKGSSA